MCYEPVQPLGEDVEFCPVVVQASCYKTDPKDDLAIFLPKLYRPVTPMWSEREGMSVSAFFERFCPHFNEPGETAERERRMLHTILTDVRDLRVWKEPLSQNESHLQRQVYDRAYERHELFGLTEVKSGLTLFQTRMWRSNDAWFITLADHIVHRWKETYVLNRVAPDLDLSRFA